MNSLIIERKPDRITIPNKKQREKQYQDKKYANESNFPNQPIIATPPEPHMIDRLMILSKIK